MKNDWSVPDHYFYRKTIMHHDKIRQGIFRTSVMYLKCPAIKSAQFTENATVLLTKDITIPK